MFFFRKTCRALFSYYLRFDIRPLLVLHIIHVIPFKK